MKFHNQYGKNLNRNKKFILRLFKAKSDYHETKSVTLIMGFFGGGFGGNK